MYQVLLPLYLAQVYAPYFFYFFFIFCFLPVVFLTLSLVHEFLLPLLYIYIYILIIYKLLLFGLIFYNLCFLSFLSLSVDYIKPLHNFICIFGYKTLIPTLILPTILHTQRKKCGRPIILLSLNVPFLIGQFLFHSLEFGGCALVIFEPNLNIQLKKTNLNK